MNATPRIHFEEIDWLDYVQDELEPEARRALAAHHAECARCQVTVESLERFSRAIPGALHLVEAGTPAADAADDVIAAVARARAGEILSAAEERRDALQTAFGGSDGSAAGFSWTPDLLEEAHPLCRERLRTEPALAGRILRSALSFIEDGRPPVDPALAASLRASLACVLVGEGRIEDALGALDAVRDALDGAPVPEIELGFWHYVRATALYNSSRPAEALDEIRSARRIYETLEDRDRLARCRQVEAVLVSDLGRPEEAVALYREILEDARLGEDRAVHATLLTNYGVDLVRTGRLEEARRIYGRAEALLKSTGQEGRLMRVRCGLADLARAEGRLEEALDSMIALREGFRALSIPWEEIQFELNIAEVLLELDRAVEAREICRVLRPRIDALGFQREAGRAIAYLAAAEQELNLSRIGRVRIFLRRLENGEDLRWSAA
ncbi:MAG TPA: tetratricopeptide repeat protein [Thermoanaerobaculia bacterium]|nr:tetratricopeptide repeat protein [Thermoanaerobaculia bacterium]